MPRFAALVVVGFFNVIVVGGCWFSADYRSGNVACHDGNCPPGLTCVAQLCVAATGDGAGSNVHDARLVDALPDTFEMAALTCADPGTFVADDTVTGTTTGRTNTISASCNGTVMNGKDAVYKIAGTIGQQVTLTPHSSAYPVAAYLIAPCTPGFPTCISNVFASDTTPATITLGSTGDFFIVVDGINAGLSGAYSLTVTLN
ncbi:MAG: hypothetical protein ABJE66_36890 [Deltaproteobacteria bacterium]